MTTYLAYIDDSGDEITAVYTAILFPAEKWSTVLRAWLTYRANLYATYSIPATFELHATELVRAGRNRPAPSLTFGVNTELSFRKRVFETALATIAAMPDVRLIGKVMPHSRPDACYVALLETIDRMMAEEDGTAIAIVDGNGSDPNHRIAHRNLKLDLRRVVEDPWHQESHASQLVQMADLASYALFQAHSLRESRKWMWGWMRKHLHSKEWDGCCGCP